MQNEVHIKISFRTQKYTYIFIVSRESFDFDFGAAELLKNPSGVSVMVNGHSNYTAEEFPPAVEGFRRHVILQGPF